MTKFIVILIIFFGLISCGKTDHSIKNPKFESNILSWKNDTIYNPDTNFLGKSRYAVYILEDLKLSGTIMDNQLLPESIAKLKIKSITLNNKCTDSFDIHGNMFFKGCQTFYGQLKYGYTYNEQGKPIEMYQLDSTNSKIVIARYKYDSYGRLIQLGPYILEYYDNGLLKSFENIFEVERYAYDENGNLNQIFFDIQGGATVCGNRTSEWRGEYDSKGRLTKDQLIAFPYGKTRYFKYSESGQLIKTINITPHEKGDIKSWTEYKYDNGMLVEIIEHPAKNGNTYSQTYKYETY